MNLSLYRKGGLSVLHRQPANTPIASVRIKRTFPHDNTAFTQGLVLSTTGESYYESTGLYGKSTIREVHLTSGKILQRYNLPPKYFAEGLTMLPSGQLVQLTWRERIAHIYNQQFGTGPVASFNWNREGWGITYYSSDTQLVISDGTATLYFLSAIAPYFLQKTITVRSWVNGRLVPVPYLNELEMIGTDLYANIWRSSRIAIIDLTTGIVKKWLDLSTLPIPSRNREAVLNGIAYHSPTKRLFVTGKLWSVLYEIEVV